MAAMPSNDVMNDSSFIDEGTFMDRDWTWSFNALWNKKSTERCRVNIADTVFVSGGEPSAWMFTAKVRMLLRRTLPAWATRSGWCCSARPQRVGRAASDRGIHGVRHSLGLRARAVASANSG